LVLPLHLGRAIFGVAAARRLIVFAPVAQLDRAPGYEPGGREFESLRAHHNFQCLRTLSRLRPFDVAIRTPGRQTSRVRQPGVRAGLDAAARSAAAVRSAAE